MPQQKQADTFTLQPSWKQFFISYMLSVLAIPLLGIGLVYLYFVRKKHKKIYYEISDTQISRVDAKYSHNVDLVDIESIDIKRSWLQQKLGIGDLMLHTSASKMILAGLEEPGQLKNILEQAIQSEIKRKKTHQKIKAKQPEYQPGNMDKMNYLTGLWQQGLISNEEYESERKHFE